MLVLPIKKEWFDKIASGEKKEEYRDIKPYYDKLFGNIFIGFPFTEEIIEHYKEIQLYDERQVKSKVEIIFRNGYRGDSPKVKCICNLRIGQGKEEWGAEPNKEYYILDILEVTNEM